jgi:hypothetical protein
MLAAHGEWFDDSDRAIIWVMRWAFHGNKATTMRR